MIYKPKELTLNSLKFRFQQKKITVYLTDNPSPATVKFSDREALELKQTYRLTDEWKDVYALLTPETADQLSVTKAVSHEFCGENEAYWSVGFLKKYCTRVLTLHFQSIGIPCRIPKCGLNPHHRIKTVQVTGYLP